MRQFKPEYFILLEEEELKSLVTARNRRDFLPNLKYFLQATKNLQMLRMLFFEAKDHEWIPPVFFETRARDIVDQNGSLRGGKQILPIPTRPGEPQMALSHDWFWEEFCAYLSEKQIAVIKTENEIILVFPMRTVMSLEDAWKFFWDMLSSREHLKQSVEIYLDNKSLFKKQASPWDSTSIPIVSKDMAQFLIWYYQYGPARNSLFKKASIEKAMNSLNKTIQNEAYSNIPLPRFEPSTINYHKGGDFHLGGTTRCGGCGEIIQRDRTSFKRLALFLKDADERPQSGRNKDDLNHFCIRCVGTLFLCPVKLTPETLTVKFNIASQTTDTFSTNLLIKQEIRKFVAQTLHVASGSFVNLHVDERIDRKPLSTIMGAYHYSLWKIAVTFPPELFAKGFGVDVYPGEELFHLPQWQLWFVSALAEWDDVFRYSCYGKKELRPHFNQYIRLISQKKIFQGFYKLLVGELIHPFYARSWKMIKLQDIWSLFETILKKEKPMPIPDYPKIVGFAGLLLPLAQRVESSRQGANKKKRSITKLLEEVDRPIQFSYTASRDSGSKDFIFCKRPSNRYFFDKTADLLSWAGEDIEKLMSEGQRIVNENQSFSWARDAEKKMFISADQIARVTGALVSEGEKPYENEADWRAFAYQVKLALWSFFPGYLGPQD